MLKPRKVKSRLTVAALLATGAVSAACSNHAESASTPPSSPSTSAASLAMSQTAASSPVRAPTAGLWRTAGTSVQGRPIRALTLGHGPRQVLFIGGIHGDEAEGSYTTTELPAAFTAADFSDRVTLTIIEDANPDGRAAKTRTNANGVDVNRNFPAPNFDPNNPANGESPLSQPESRTVHYLIEATKPDLIVVMHSWHDKQFINFDGPARQIADRFATTSGLPVTASTEFAPTPGSLGSYAGRDRKRPVLTIELRKGSDPKAAREQIRTALLEAIGG